MLGEALRGALCSVALDMLTITGLRFNASPTTEIARTTMRKRRIVGAKRISESRIRVKKTCVTGQTTFSRFRHLAFPQVARGRAASP